MCDSEKSFTPKELAERHPALFTERSLKLWRSKGVGPKFVRPAGTYRIAYLESDVNAWIAQGKKLSDDTAAAEALPAAIEHLATLIAQLPAGKRRKIAAEIGGAFG